MGLFVIPSILFILSARSFAMTRESVWARSFQGCPCRHLCLPAGSHKCTSSIPCPIRKIRQVGFFLELQWYPVHAPFVANDAFVLVHTVDHHCSMTSAKKAAAAMLNTWKFKKGDTVMIARGRNRGRVAQISEIIRDGNTATRRGRQVPRHKKNRWKENPKVYLDGKANAVCSH